MLIKESSRGEFKVKWQWETIPSRMAKKKKKNLKIPHIKDYMSMQNSHTMLLAVWTGTFRKLAVSS